MILEHQSVKLLTPHSDGGEELLKLCEFAGRNCYASQDKITAESYMTFVRNLITRGHESPLEFGDMSFDITTSRAVLAELTRHRLASFCVESQRYIQEAKSGDITFILPEWYLEEGDSIVQENSRLWKSAMSHAEETYKQLISGGAKPEEAREVLPNSTACRIIMKANLREWRHIFTLRCGKAAYPQIRSLMTNMLKIATFAIPVVYDDIYEEIVMKGERNNE